MKDTVKSNGTKAAALMRAALKADFPRTSFSVRQHINRMTHQYVVQWSGGPSEEQVQQVARPFVVDVPYGSIYCVRDDGDAS